MEVANNYKVSAFQRWVINLSILGAVSSLFFTDYRFVEDLLGFGEILIVLGILGYFLFKPSFNSSYMRGINRFMGALFLIMLLAFVFTVLFFSRDVLFFEKYLQGVLRNAGGYLIGTLNGYVIAACIRNTDDFYYVVKKIIQLYILVVLAVFALRLSDLAASLIGGIRFHGLSANPNQMGSFSSVIPFLTLYLFIRKKISKLFLVSGVGISMLLAFAIKSDALFYSYIFAGGALFAFYFFRERQKSLIFHLSFFIGVIVLLVYADNILDYFITTNEDGNQAGVRFLLWENAFLAFLRSPLIGFGPGSFSGIEGPCLGAEAHNTVLDLLTNVGLVGIVVYAVFLGRLFIGFFRQKEAWLFASLTAFICFSLFHNVLRHPAFWIILFVMYVKCEINKVEKDANLRHDSRL